MLLHGRLLFLFAVIGLFFALWRILISGGIFELHILGRCTLIFWNFRKLIHSLFRFFLP